MTKTEQLEQALGRAVAILEPHLKSAFEAGQGIVVLSVHIHNGLLDRFKTNHEDVHYMQPALKPLPKPDTRNLSR